MVASWRFNWIRSIVLGTGCIVGSCGIFLSSIGFHRVTGVCFLVVFQSWGLPLYGSALGPLQRRHRHVAANMHMSASGLLICAVAWVSTSWTSNYQSCQPPARKYPNLAAAAISCEFSCPSAPQWVDFGRAEDRGTLHRNVRLSSLMPQ